MTDPVLKSAIESTILLEYDEIYESAEDENIQFSEGFEKKMDKLIRKRKRPYYKLVNTAAKKVALFTIVFLSVSVITVLKVDALRNFFNNIFMEMFSDHSHITVRSESDDSSDTVIYPDKIESKYDITSDMSGYKREIISDNEMARLLVYSKNDIVVSVYQHTIPDFVSDVNTENSEIDHIDINGKEAIGFLDNQNYYTLIWNNGEYVIQISSNIGKDALIEIAKSVQKVE